ncbi:hypothetical protein BDR07DRAFT_1464628 [Suillus spraguei]|nr:hypothetical protein BDR07DRAFT_1464628 [Suillus spraguei]
MSDSAAVGHSWLVLDACRVCAFGTSLSGFQFQTRVSFLDVTTENTESATVWQCSLLAYRFITSDTSDPRPRNITKPEVTIVLPNPSRHMYGPQKLMELTCLVRTNAGSANVNGLYIHTQPITLGFENPYHDSLAVTILLVTSRLFLLKESL